MKHFQSGQVSQTQAAHFRSESTTSPASLSSALSKACQCATIWPRSSPDLPTFPSGASRNSSLVPGPHSIPQLWFHLVDPRLSAESEKNFSLGEP